MAIPGIRGVSKVVHEVNTNKLNLIDAFDSCRMSQIILEMPLECLEGKRMNRKKSKFISYTIGNVHVILWRLNVRMILRYCPSCGFNRKQDKNMQQKLLFTFDKKHMTSFAGISMSVFSREDFLCNR